MSFYIFRLKISFWLIANLHTLICTYILRVTTLFDQDIFTEAEC